jgi:uncharacterized protein YecT (DUF1311 family)
MKKVLLVLTGSLLLSSTSSLVWAANCSQLTTQGDLNQCIGTEYEAADKYLNDVYAAYRTRLSDTEKKELKNVQLAWIKYRDLSCKFESSGALGGSAYPMVLGACLAAKTRARAEEIKNLGECEEGDTSCTFHNK